jgi:DNA-binding NarL/FixJ family response regulator
MILSQQPDIVISDIGLPGINGFEVLDRLNSLAPKALDMPFIFLTALTDRDSQLKGRKLGADDYVTKPIDFDILESIIYARLSKIARLSNISSAVNLNERELEVLTWSARGKTSEEIAMILHLSPRTVNFHIDNAREKLGVTTRTQAVVKAVTVGMINP